MKILVLSDSHSSLGFMRQCVASVKPDAVVHLGDHYDDAEVLKEENQHIPFHMLPGNCDRYRCPYGTPQMMCYSVCGVRLYMTHGHMYSVKLDTERLLADARQANAQAVLYGHTPDRLPSRVGRHVGAQSRQQRLWRQRRCDSDKRRYNYRLLDYQAGGFGGYLS